MQLCQRVRKTMPQLVQSSLLVRHPLCDTLLNLPMKVVAASAVNRKRPEVPHLERKLAQRAPLLLLLRSKLQANWCLSSNSSASWKPRCRRCWQLRSKLAGPLLTLSLLQLCVRRCDWVTPGEPPQHDGYAALACKKALQPSAANQRCYAYITYTWKATIAVRSLHTPRPAGVSRRWAALRGVHAVLEQSKSPPVGTAPGQKPPEEHWKSAVRPHGG